MLLETGLQIKTCRLLSIDKQVDHCQRRCITQSVAVMIVDLFDPAASPFVS